MVGYRAMEGEVCGCHLACARLLIGTHRGHMNYNHLVISALTLPYRRHRSSDGELDVVSWQERSA